MIVSRQARPSHAASSVFTQAVSSIVSPRLTMDTSTSAGVTGERNFYAVGSADRDPTAPASVVPVSPAGSLIAVITYCGGRKR